MKIKDIAMPSLKTCLYSGVSLAAISVAYFIAKFGAIAAVLSCVPLLIYVILCAIKSPYWAYTMMFVVGYFIMGAVRYVPSLQGGVITDVLIMFTFAVLLIRSCYKKVYWERARTGLVVAASIWLLYCLFELFNPMSSSLGWIKSIRGVALYLFFISILTPIIFYRYKDLKRLLVILSVLTLMAVLKALIQKYFGFDVFEKRWLYVDGGMSTHIIYSGIRYFSFYTDAANFGGGMGLAMVVFSITALYTKTTGMRIYFLIVAAFAAYGMIISGTRGALAVPFAGYALYVMFLTRNIKIAIIGGLLLLAALILLKFTTIGQSVSEIRRMRSAFNIEDASLKVRLDNQKKLAAFMVDHPFGSGLGMGGGKAKLYAPNAFLSQIPTDSWFVMIWVETGIVGVILHISLLFYVLIYGCYLVVVRLKDTQLRGIISALLAGIFGVMVASYGNEILGQLPTALIIYMFLSFVFQSVRYDKELSGRDVATKLVEER